MRFWVVFSKSSTIGADLWLISSMLIPEFLYSFKAFFEAFKADSGKQAGPALKLYIFFKFVKYCFKNESKFVKKKTEYQ